MSQLRLPMCVQIRVKRCAHEPSQLKRDIATVRVDGLIGNATLFQSGLNGRLPSGSGGGGGDKPPHGVVEY